MYEPSANEVLTLLENKINTGQYNDSVHKIKLMTARDVLKEILASRT